MLPEQANLTPAESLSALVDGEVGAQHLLASMPSSVRSDWDSYQTIGHVLRAPSSAAAHGADPAFVERLMQRLKHETFEPALPLAAAVMNTAVNTVASQDAVAANDGVFRWKLVAGFASFSAVAVFAWTLTSNPPTSQQQQLAAQPSNTELLVASPQGTMVRDARLEELLSAHKQLGGTSLQAPSGFLRNAGFDSTSSGQR